MTDKPSRWVPQAVFVRHFLFHAMTKTLWTHLTHLYDSWALRPPLSTPAKTRPWGIPEFG